MQCQKCKKEVPFLEWFIYNYKHKKCLQKERDEQKKKKDKREKEESLNKKDVVPFYNSGAGFKIFFVGLIIAGISYFLYLQSHLLS